MKKKKSGLPMKKSSLAIKKLLAFAVIAAIGISIFAIIKAGEGNKAGTKNAAQDSGSQSAGTADYSPVQMYVENAGYAQTVEGLEMPEDIYEIRERMFLAQVNDVYLNHEDYLGKAIKLEGIFKSERYMGLPGTYNYVMRYGPGCCGNDGFIGFEVSWADSQSLEYPKPESWVEAIGVLKSSNNGGYIYLDLLSLTVLSKRGIEIIAQ